jgi:hypothetical protein
LEPPARHRLHCLFVRHTVSCFLSDFRISLSRSGDSSSRLGNAGEPDGGPSVFRRRVPDGERKRFGPLRSNVKNAWNRLGISLISGWNQPGRAWAGTAGGSGDGRPIRRGRAAFRRKAFVGLGQGEREARRRGKDPDRGEEIPKGGEDRGGFGVFRLAKVLVKKGN